jgi:hypothetical protein
MSQDPLDLLPRQHDRRAFRLLGPDDPVEPVESDSKDLPVQEEQGNQRQVLGCRGDAGPCRNMGEKRFDLLPPHLPRVAHPVKAEESADPGGVCLLGPSGILNAGPFPEHSSNRSAGWPGDNPGGKWYRPEGKVRTEASEAA